MFDKIDSKRDELFRIFKGSFVMKRVIIEVYYKYIYYLNVIEGNIMILFMIRVVVEIRMVVFGKSILEYNEVLGFDEVLKFINGILL